MFFDQERQLIVLDKTEREAAVLMDLETEKVVRELDAGGYEVGSWKTSLFQRRHQVPALFCSDSSCFGLVTGERLSD